MPHSPRLKLLALLAAAALSACGGANATRYLVETGAAASAPAAPIRLRVATIELREVVLPAYGEGSQILAEAPDGGLVPVRGGQWADGSARAITAELARSLDLRSTASVAAEPWPLAEPADIRLEVRIERLIARAGGDFQLGGQYVVASPDGRMREFMERFELTAPIPDETAGPRAIAAAYGQALEQLSGLILTRLARR